MANFHIKVLRWSGIVLGAAALIALALTVWQNYQIEFWSWSRPAKLTSATALILLLVASRLRFAATRLEARQPLPTTPVAPGQLNPKLQVYENRSPAVAAAAAPPPGAPAPAPEPDFALQLRKLHDLKNAGILTEEEYQAKKTSILNKL